MADLKEIPNRNPVVDPGDEIVTRPWNKWLTDLRLAVNRLIAGIFDGDVTIAGNLTVMGAITAASAVISGMIVAASAVFTGAISAASAAISGKVVAGTYIGNVVAPAALGASQNNYAPAGLSTAYVLALSATGPINITGIDATGFEDGRPLIIANIGTPVITLTHEDAASTATNRLFFYDAANRAIGNGRSVLMHRNPSLNNRWVLVGA